MQDGEFAEEGGALGFEVPVFRERRANMSSSALSTLSIGSIGTFASNIGSGLGIHHLGHGHGHGSGDSGVHNGSGIFGGSSASGRRKKLVVAGIAHEDDMAVKGLKRWCEVSTLSLVLVSPTLLLAISRLSYSQTFSPCTMDMNTNNY